MPFGIRTVTREFWGYKNIQFIIILMLLIWEPHQETQNSLCWLLLLILHASLGTIESSNTNGLIRSHRWPKPFKLYHLYTWLPWNTSVFFLYFRRPHSVPSLVSLLAWAKWPWSQVIQHPRGASFHNHFVGSWGHWNSLSKRPWSHF